MLKANRSYLAQENKTADSQIIVGGMGGDAHLDMARGSMVETDAARDVLPTANYPTEEERLTLRRVAGKMPTIAYVICAVEFAERASYYGN